MSAPPRTSDETRAVGREGLTALPRASSAEDGATTVEYGILAGAVGIVLVAVGPAMAAAFLDLLELIVGGFSR